MTAMSKRSLGPRLVTAVAVLALGLVGLRGPAGYGAQLEDSSVAPATPQPLGAAVPPEVSEHPHDWPLPTGDYAAHRAAFNSPISAATVDQLRPAWAFQIEASAPWGGMATMPVVVGTTVYVQDLKSNVFALERATGEVKWAAY